MGLMKQRMWLTWNSWNGNIYVFAKSAEEAARKVNKHLLAEAKKNDDIEFVPVTKVEIVAGAVLV
jgi:hypothetical protein